MVLATPDMEGVVCTGWDICNIAVLKLVMMLERTNGDSDCAALPKLSIKLETTFTVTPILEAKDWLSETGPEELLVRVDSKLRGAFETPVFRKRDRGTEAAPFEPTLLDAVDEDST